MARLSRGHPKLGEHPVLNLEETLSFRTFSAITSPIAQNTLRCRQTWVRFARGARRIIRSGPCDDGGAGRYSSETQHGSTGFHVEEPAASRFRDRRRREPIDRRANVEGVSRRTFESRGADGLENEMASSRKLSGNCEDRIGAFDSHLGRSRPS